MSALKEVLMKSITRNERTARYQAAIDDYVDALKEQWDIERGMVGARGIALPHESIQGFWELDEEERHKLTAEDAREVYELNAGRGGTHWLAVAAFAWLSPISRHHHDPQLLRFFENGIRFFISTIRDDGILGIYGLNGLTWAHGWDIEGIIYGLTLLMDVMDKELKDWALSRLRLSAQRFVQLGPSGTHGNQGCVQALGLYLYGCLLNIPEAIEASNKRWAELVPKVLNEDGQVKEQYGPCMHYSYTCFIYAWLNAFIRQEQGIAGPLEKCLLWFRYKHTESLYPLPGPSSRMYKEKLEGSAVDILPCCEQLGARNPMFLKFADSIWELTRGSGAGGHGASPLMWAILACPGQLEPTPTERARWARHFEAYYERIRLLGRSPLKYLIVRRAYQTQFVVRDFLPFSGVQTWAWGNEPPIIHPTILAQSTTQAWGLDTARQGVSHNWGLFGAGAMEPDFKYRIATEPGQPTYLLARFDLVWRFVVFTDLSTVILEWGRQGNRRTLWTLNRLAPVPFELAHGKVIFAGQTARLYSTTGQPVTRGLGPGKWTEGVRILEYNCGDAFSAFAFSNDSFSFGAADFMKTLTLEFEDAAGQYTVRMPAGLVTADNPGACTLSRGHLFWEIKVEKR